MNKNHCPFETYAHYKVGKGFATLAVSVDNDLVKVGIAYCHPRDRLNKGFGRIIASNRRDTGSDFSFEFSRDLKRRLGDQLHDEFECFIIESGHSINNGSCRSANSHRRQAPLWIICSLGKEIKRRHLKAAGEISSKAAALFNDDEVLLDCESFELSRQYNCC